MFYRLLLICLFLPVFASESTAQTDRNLVVEAISAANAGRLSTLFAKSVTVSLPAHKGSFSCNQARSMLQEFFKQNPPHSFMIINNGKTTQSNHFILGTYISGKGANFSVYILFSVVSGKERITGITFENK